MGVDPVRHVVGGPQSGWTRLAGALLWLALAGVAVEFAHQVYLKYASLDSPAYAMFMTRRGWLWCHLGGGGVGLMLGLLQFVTQRWRRHPALHRWIGRAYFAGMGVGIAGAAGLIVTSPAPVAIRVAFAATGLVWLVVGSVGLAAIRRGRVALHARWMLRAYLVTLHRCCSGWCSPRRSVPGAPSPGLVAGLLWSSWVVPLSLHALGVRAIKRWQG
ncbi:DUF2306 domain-containing protein, partial [Xanthomonas sp. Kuri4-3]